MSYRVAIVHEAEKNLDRLDRPAEQRIRARIIQLAADPFDPRLSAPLTERPGIRKSRVGGCSPRTAIPEPCSCFTVDTRGQVYKHS